MMNVLLLLSTFLCPFCVSQYIPSSYPAWFRHRDDSLLQHLRNFQFNEKNYTISPFKGKYFQALHFCNYYGMALVSIETKEENNKIHEHILSYGFSNDFFWTSGNKLADGRNWLWATSGQPIQFANWQYLEPNNKYGLEKCIELRQTPQTLDWNDVSCFDSDVYKYFICDKKVESECENAAKVDNSVPLVQFVNAVEHQEPIVNQNNRAQEFRSLVKEDDCMQYSVDNEDDQQIHININFD